MEKASDDAQLQKVKQLCTGETCFIDPKEVFDTSLCPGTILPLPKCIGFSAKKTQVG